MNHKGTVTLETKRLILRRFKEEDADAMFRNWASDPIVSKFLTWPAHASAEVSASIIKSWIENYVTPSWYQWGIEYKELGEVIGGISCVRVDEGIEKVEIGYCIGKEWWHKGIMTEAFTRVLEFLFTEIGVNRVEAKHDINNPNSGAVMKKCGLQYEGTYRQADRNNQGLCNCSVYGILKEEWEKHSENPQNS